VRHRPGVERHDLVIRFVGGDEAGCRELVVDLGNAGGVHPLALHPRPVLPEVPTGAGDHQWALAEQGQRVGDVARHATAQLAHGIDQEADAQHVGPVLYDVVFEMTGKAHDVIVGQRAGYDDPQGSLLRP
jgi:hypothetical protein